MQDDIKTFIKTELVTFGIEYQAQRKAFLAKKISATGQLSDSIAATVDAESRADTVAMMLSFEEYGRYIDMKRLKAVVPRGGQDSEYVRAIEDWIRARGWEDKFIEKFKQIHNLRVTTPQMLGQIAMGIAIQRAKRVRPKRWFNNSKTAGFADVFNRVAAGLPDKAADVLVKTLNVTRP
jgi:hypothetical protein